MSDGSGDGMVFVIIHFVTTVLGGCGLDWRIALPFIARVIAHGSCARWYLCQVWRRFRRRRATGSAMTGRSTRTPTNIATVKFFHTRSAK